ncbi:hypothetical protein BKA69DRAFT_694110 [Paraphysoderma sedebokerense]|nr:hypothetical protein BKA69DRAFT_694110 [Paraphysoderma sedebokerense]
MSLAAPVTPPQVLHVSVFLPSMMKSAWAPYLPCTDSWTPDSMDTSSTDQINEDQMFTSTVETIPSPPRQLDLSTDTQTHVPLTPPHSNPSDSPPYSKSITLPPCTPSIVCIDIEAYEFDHKKVTEIGYSIGYFNPQLNRYEVSAHHIIIKEYMNLVNGVRVPNWKFGFLFGESKILSLSNAALEMRRVLKDVNVVVGHGVANDLVWLKKMGVKIDGKKICDVQVLFKAVKGNIECVKLEKVLEYCGIESDRLHNGGRMMT